MTTAAAHDDRRPQRARRRGAAVVMVLVVVGALVAARPVDAADPAVVVTEAGTLEHLEALAAIADANGGNRAVRSPGFDASVAYVTEQLEAAGYDVETTPVPLDVGIEVRPPRFERTAPSARTYVEGTDYVQPLPPARTIISGDVLAVGDGCEPDDFDALPPMSIVLVSLGGCDPGLPALFASIFGATGVLLVAEGGVGVPPEQVDLGGLPAGDDLPVLSLSGDAGLELEALAAGSTTTVEIDTGWEASTFDVPNVVAELPGTTDDVVVLGAHLDSVPSGPGINDNGSGVAALLEIAEAVRAADIQTEATLRFGLWAAEEEGLLGSTAYVESLARITAYLNVDMIGSPNPVRFIYDPAAAELPDTVSPGSAAITERFAAHFDDLGLPYEGIWTNGRSDDAAFARAGIPVGGLFTGAEQLKTPAQAAVFGGTAGAPMDPCYHLACDDLTNVDVALTAELGTAWGVVALELAVVVPDPPPTTVPTTTTATPASAATPVRAAPSFTG